MRVDFVIGGTQKGGTSALDSFLRQHPEICMPATRKELHFFDREAENTDYNAYHANFDPKPAHRVIGEASPIYMYWKTAPSRIWNYNPKMKWIVALRNPVERAFSAWNMETKRGKEKLSFAEAIEKVQLLAGDRHANLRMLSQKRIQRRRPALLRPANYKINATHYFFIIASRFGLNSFPVFHSGNLSALATW